MTGGQSAGEKFRLRRCVEGFSSVIGHQYPSIEVMLPSKIGIVPVILGLHAEIQFSVDIQKPGGLYPLDLFILHIFFQIRRFTVDHIHTPVSCIGQSFRCVTHCCQFPDICRTALVVSGTTIHAAVFCPGHGPHVSFPTVIPETVQQDLLYIIRLFIRRFCLGI